MIMTEPGGHSDARRSATASAPLLSRSAGPLAIAAGTLLIVGQAIWWPFDQQKNLATAQNDIFNAGSVIYFCGFCVVSGVDLQLHRDRRHRRLQSLALPLGHSPRLGCSDTWWVDAAPSFRGHDQFKPWSSRTTATTAN